MKQLFLLIAILFSVSVSSSCQSRKCYDNYQVSIDLQGDFRKEIVEVLLDGQSIMKGVVQTGNNGLGMRKVIVFPEGTHSILIKVNNRLIKSDQFTLRKNEYIGISYYPITQRVNINYSDIEFHYSPVVTHF